MFIRLLIAILCLSALAARADSGATEQLLAQLANLQQLQGSFTQHQYGDDGSDLGKSSGSFQLLQPGYFTWDIQAPDSQLVIAGPEYIWHYDRDLETVTRRPVNGNAAMSPLQVLGGEERALRDNYDVRAGQDKGQFILEPRTADAGFRTLTLQFSDSQIQTLKFTDNLGQRIDIELDDLDADSKLSSADFDFTPPEGVDLFYHDE